MRSNDVGALASRLARSSLYLLLALPFGIVIFITIATGFAMGIGASVVFWGIPILILTVAICRWFGLLERELTSRLLDASFRELPRPDPNLGWWAKLKWYLSNRYTWTSILYAALKLPVGIAAFTVLTISIATPLALISAPFWTIRGEIQLAGWHFDSLAESLIAVPVGLLILPISMALILAMGWFMRVLAELLLGGSKWGVQAEGQTNPRPYPEPGNAHLADA